MREKFTDDQWAAIRSAPEWIGAAVASVGKSGVMGTLKEDGSIRVLIKEKGEKYPRNPIIQPILLELGLRSPKMKISIDEQHWELRQRYKSGQVGHDDVLPDFALEILNESVGLITESADPRDVVEYKRWVLEMGQAVAEVAKEGGFLGIGGERVSQAESDFLERVRAVLKV